MFSVQIADSVFHFAIICWNFSRTIFKPAFLTYFCGMLKYSKAFLSRLEDLVSESGYIVRYEKGHFKSGYCVLKESKLVLINTFLTLEGRVNCLAELIGILEITNETLTDKSKKLFLEIKEFQLIRKDNPTELIS